MALPPPAQRPSSRSPAPPAAQRRGVYPARSARSPLIAAPCLNFASSPASLLGTSFSSHFPSLVSSPLTSHHNSSAAARPRLRLMQGAVTS